MGKLTRGVRGGPCGSPVPDSRSDGDPCPRAHGPHRAFRQLPCLDEPAGCSQRGLVWSDPSWRMDGVLGPLLLCPCVPRGPRLPTSSGAWTLSRIPQGNSSCGFHKQAETRQRPGLPPLSGSRLRPRLFSEAQERRRLAYRRSNFDYLKRWVGTLPAGPRRVWPAGPGGACPSPSSGPGAASPAHTARHQLSAQGPRSAETLPRARPGLTGLGKVSCSVGVDAFKKGRVYF